jgi:hypothetical protein
MDKLKETIGRLETIRDEVGYSVYFSAVKAVNRQRLENGEQREKRKVFPQSKYLKLYQQCGGFCWWCQSNMVFIRRKVEIDHFDPNKKEGFNDDPNLSLIHWDCNREKGSKSLTEQAEYLHITTTELIQRFNRTK